MNLPSAVAASLIVALLAAAPTSASTPTSTGQPPLLASWWCDVWITKDWKVVKPVLADSASDVLEKARAQWGHLGDIGICRRAKSQ